MPDLDPAEARVVLDLAGACLDRECCAGFGFGGEPVAVEVVARRDRDPDLELAVGGALGGDPEGFVGGQDPPGLGPAREDRGKILRLQRCGGDEESR